MQLKWDELTVIRGEIARMKSHVVRIDNALGSASASDLINLMKAQDEYVRIILRMEDKASRLSNGKS